MRKPLANFVLYNNVPQRHYRQIAALYDDNTYQSSVWEGDILQIEPFEKIHSNVNTVICTTEQEAVEMARKDYEKSLQAGWSDYDPRAE